MRISHLVYSGFGGAGNIVLSLILESKKEKIFNNDIIFTGPFLDKDYKNQSKNLKKTNFFFIKTIRFFSFLSWFQTFKKLMLIKPRIILLHNYQIIPCFFFQIFQKSKIIVVDHSALNYKSFRDKVMVFFIKYLKCNVVVLNQENFEFYKKNNIHPKKIHIINNGIDTSFYKKKKKFNLKRPSFNLGMAARIDYFKRHDLIIDSISSKKLKSNNIKLFFAGDGKNVNFLKEKSRRLGFSKKIIFNKKLNQKKLKEWFSNLDLYVHATTGEAMSTAILQAMSMKVPVIASRVNGNISFFKSIGKLNNTFINNKKNLVNKIYFFYDRYNEKKRELENIRKLIEKKYSQKIMYKNYKKLILKIDKKY